MIVLAKNELTLSIEKKMKTIKQVKMLLTTPFVLQQKPNLAETDYRREFANYFNTDISEAFKIFVRLNARQDVIAEPFEKVNRNLL